MCTHVCTRVCMCVLRVCVCVHVFIRCASLGYKLWIFEQGKLWKLSSKRKINNKFCNFSCPGTKYLTEATQRRKDLFGICFQKFLSFIVRKAWWGGSIHGNEQSSDLSHDCTQEADDTGSWRSLHLQRSTLPSCLLPPVSSNLLKAPQSTYQTSATNWDQACKTRACGGRFR